MITFVTATLNKQKPDSTIIANDPSARADQRSDITMARAGRLPLRSNNPFFSTSEPLGPVSPVEQQQNQSLFAPEPRHLATIEKSADPRQTMEFPHGGSNPARRVKVAKDMYNGQTPPRYESPATHTAIVPPQDMVARPSEQYVSCSGCGRKRVSANGETDDSNQGRALGDCTRCGKRKVSISSSSNIFPMRSSSLLNDTATTMATQRSVLSPAGNIVTPRPCCNKCGRDQRPNQAYLSSRHQTASSGNTNTDLSQQPQPLYKSPSFGVEAIRQNHRALPRLQAGAFVEIDVTPPTATSSRPANSPFPDDAPLLDGRAKKASKLSRSASIASAISRTFSRRKSKKASSTAPPVPTVDNPLPIQQPKYGGENNSGKFTDSTSYTSHDKVSQSQANLNVEESKIVRPDSPFSFTDKPTEQEAFEMNEIRVSKLDTKPDFNFLKSPYSAPLPAEANPLLQPASRPEHLRSKSEAAMNTLTVPQQDDVYLANPNQRPTITRFKSLRVGVERAASVTRSTSLKRLNSIKKTPELWYRTDMSFEGAIGAY